VGLTVAQFAARVLAEAIDEAQLEVSDILWQHWPAYDPPAAINPFTFWELDPES
jgi:hypothetical protein